MKCNFVYCLVNHFYSQLIVCKGLVINHLRQLKYETIIPPYLYCSSSYGIVYNEPFDNQKIYSQRTPILKDPNNGKKYAVGQIYWFIRRGEPISRDKPISRYFHRIVDVRKPEITWKDIIAKSISPAERLPPSIYDGDATAPYDVESKLSIDTLERTDGTKRKQKRLAVFKTRKHFRKIGFQVLVYVTLAKLRFEVQSQGNTIGSRTITVEWEPEPGGPTGDGAERIMEEDGDNWHHGLISKGST